MIININIITRANKHIINYHLVWEMKPDKGIECGGGVHLGRLVKKVMFERDLSDVGLSEPSSIHMLNCFSCI